MGKTEVLYPEEGKKWSETVKQDKIILKAYTKIKF